MIKEFAEKWDKYKNNLEEYDSYEKIVKLLFEQVINKNIDYHEFDTKNILVIDDGDYQGTQIFILHRDTYQPNIEDYVYTNVCYGSCSGCDTLLSISEYEEDKPTEKQIIDYMTLALHLLQRCTYMKESE